MWPPPKIKKWETNTKKATKYSLRRPPQSSANCIGIFSGPVHSCISQILTEKAGEAVVLMLSSRGQRVFFLQSASQGSTLRIKS